MTYLQRLPVAELKIDRSFVTNLASDPSDRAIVRAMVELGHSLGLRVVAEGVEDQGAWDELANLGCHEVQGYFIARPMPRSHFETWVDDARSSLPAAA